LVKCFIKATPTPTPFSVKSGALQDAIFNSAYFSSIATDEKGVINHRLLPDMRKTIVEFKDTTIHRGRIRWAGSLNNLARAA